MKTMTTMLVIIIITITVLTTMEVHSIYLYDSNFIKLFSLYAIVGFRNAREILIFF